MEMIVQPAKQRRSNISTPLAVRVSTDLKANFILVITKVFCRANFRR